MRKLSSGRHLLLASATITTTLIAFAPEASADVSCVEGRCTTASAQLTLDGKEPLRTTIQTGWMPSCSDGREHCNKGLQVRAGVALTAAQRGGNLFTASMLTAGIHASWEELKYLNLSVDSFNGASSLSITHTLTPEAELYVDIGPIEQGFMFPATRLIQYVPGSNFQYQASAWTSFSGWADTGISLNVPAPALTETQLVSINLRRFPDIIQRAIDGSFALHARTSPTFTYKTTRIVIDGKDVKAGASTQFPFPSGDRDYIEYPATIEGELTATGDLEVMPSATLAHIGDMVFDPPTTITFSTVSVKKHFETPPQKYVFEHKTIRIPLPNVRRPYQGNDNREVVVGEDGPVTVTMVNTGEAVGEMRLESSDPRFTVPTTFSVSPKSKTPLDISFHPEGLGEARTTITAHTNDPDTPVLTFEVVGEGVKERHGANGSSGGDDTDVISGCGCTTVGTPVSRGAGLGAFALGLLTFTRRRRTRR